MNNAELIIACTLDPELVRERVGEWAALVAASESVEPIDGGVRLRFPRGGSVGGGGGGVTAAAVAALSEAERDCCPFFVFTLTVDESGTTLDVTAPADARPLVDTLLSLP